MSDFLAVLDAEIAELERQLSQSPTYVKLARAKDLRDAYLVTEARRVPAVPRVVRPSATGNSAAILQVVRGHLRGRSTPTRTRDLMEILATAGVEVNGNVPQNIVSSLLSKTPDIISHGRSGWTVADAEKAGDDTPGKDASPAPVQPLDTPEDRERSVAHDNTLDVFR